MTDNHNFSIQGYNLVTLLKRLEAATSRLEDVTVFQEKHVSTKDETTTSISTPQITEPIVPKLESAPIADPIEEIPNSIKEFDLFIKENIDAYVEISKKIDPVLGEQSEIFKEAIIKEREVLKAANKSKKLNMEDEKFQKLIILPINKLIMKVIEIKDNNRQNNNFNFLNAVSEGVPVLGWIVTTTPVSYIPDFKDSAQFWTNRILKDCKGKENENECIEWVKKFLKIFDELKNYVKEYQTTGISWGGSEDFEKVLNSEIISTGTSVVAGAGAGAGGVPPPPPPPPPANLFDDDKPIKTEEVGMGAVFAELNKGESITSGLKKVDKSQMTHKNPELRKKQAPMPPKKPKNLTSSSNITTNTTNTSSINKVKKSGSKELVDNKWMITNMTKEEIVDNENGMIIIDGNLDQSIYIGNCEEIIVQIKGKVNAISINNCNKIGIIIDKAISSVEVTKCLKCEIQIIEEVPIINIDQSESTNIYLSKSSLGVEIYSSCCTALNVNIPTISNDDTKEIAVSEQFVTRFKIDEDNKTLEHVTEAVKHG